MDFDAIVLGGGIVGVSVALHLALRGKSVVLVDRGSPGSETSFGNAGLIQREAVVPYGFPQNVVTILRHALNQSVDTSYHLSAMPEVAPALLRYWWNSRPGNHLRIQREYEPLIRHSVSEHERLIELAGAQSLVGKEGWFKAFRSTRSRDEAFIEADRLERAYGVAHRKLTGTTFREVEPGIAMNFAGVIQWTSAWTVSAPGGLVEAYAALLARSGGKIAKGNGLNLAQSGAGWSLETGEGRITAGQAAIALGPWSSDLTSRLGYRLPLFVKRGYHAHYRVKGGGLRNPVMDTDVGYMLSPMQQGIRLATGAEFARRDAPPSPVQLDRAERAARQVVPLEERIEGRPWMGARPCTPDMKPVIGPAPMHKNLWFAFGHAHHGFTLGPVTGRVVAEMMSGETPFVDVAPFGASRFTRVA